MRSSPWFRRSMAGIAFGVVVLASIGEARATDKDCIAAASTGQEVRDQGRLLEARRHFQRCAQVDCPAPIPTYCSEWLSDVGKKIPSLVIRVVDGDGRDVTEASVIIDERESELDGRAIEVDPGKHRIRITRAGMRPFETEVLAAQGEKDRVVVGKLFPTEPPPSASEPRTAPPPRRARPAHRAIPTASWVAWGIGAAGLVSFSIFGVKARLDYDGYQSSCGQLCAVSDRDSVATAVTVADISLVVGLLGATAGTVLYLMQPTVDARPIAAARGIR